MPLPATYANARTGLVYWRFAELNYTKRFKNDRISETLRKVHENIKIGHLLRNRDARSGTASLRRYSLDLAVSYLFQLYSNFTTTWQEPAVL